MGAYGTDMTRRYPYRLTLTGGEYRTLEKLSGAYATAEAILERAAHKQFEYSKDPYGEEVLESVVLWYDEPGAWQVADTFEADDYNLGPIHKEFYNKLWLFLDSIV